jgi:hypothetical protein
MSYLLLGTALLIVGLIIVHQLSRATPSGLARWIKRILFALAIAGAAYLLTSGRLAQALPLILGAAALLIRFGRLAGGARTMGGASGGGGTSKVETDYLRMTLDHDSGSMAGTVLRGRFAGREIGTLSLDELVELYLECLRSDEPAARLVESFLDRGPHAARWREHVGGPGPEGGRPDAAMSVVEACLILGVSEAAGEEEIRAAHHRLMVSYHPDRGGSTYLAAKINQARDVLLGARRRTA